MIDDVVGATPVVLLRRVAPIRVKLELRSPNGTVMDRVGKHLAAAAGAGPWRVAGDGALAIAVAMQGALRGQPVEVFLPENVTLEVRQSLLVYKAKVTLTPFEKGPAGSLEAARAAGPVLTDRFPAAMSEASAAVGRELLASEDRLDALVGSEELLGGAGDVLRTKFPQLRLASWRPFEGPWRPHRQAGVFASEAPRPESFAGVVDDAAAWAMRTRLGKEEGLLVSIAAAAAIALAARLVAALPEGARVVALATETGERDFSLAGQF